MAKIIVKTEDCIGCGACQVACDELFELNSDKITLKDAKDVDGNQEIEVEDIKCAEDAADVCPTQCIKVEK